MTSTTVDQQDSTTQIPDVPPFEQIFQDHRHAQKASNAVIYQHADAEAQYAAGRAMLAAEGKLAGIRAYWATLEGESSVQTREAARMAYDASLQASADYRAQKAAEAAMHAEDADESWTAGDADGEE